MVEQASITWLPVLISIIAAIASWVGLFIGWNDRRKFAKPHIEFFRKYYDMV